MLHIVAAIIISVTMLGTIRRDRLARRLPGHLIEWAVILVALYLIGLWAFPFWFLYSATRGGINVARGLRGDGSVPTTDVHQEALYAARRAAGDGR